MHCVHKWVRVIIEGSETHALKYSEENNERGEFAVKSDACETPIHAINREDINSLLADYDILPDHENTQINTEKTDQPIYKEGCKCNVMDHRRS